MRIRIFSFSLLLVTALLLQSCGGGAEHLSFQTLDTEFSKGRLGYQQQHDLEDLVQFHGHRCDGLVVGALAMEQVRRELYPGQPLDRTNLRAVSRPAPCLTDVAVYLTGGRYQYHTFYVDPGLEGLFVVQRIDNGRTVSVALRPGIKPAAIDSLGARAVAGKLAPCELDHLRALEDNFSKTLLQADPDTLFILRERPDFEWEPHPKSDYRKTDVLNKNLPECE